MAKLRRRRSTWWRDPVSRFWLTACSGGGDLGTVTGCGAVTKVSPVPLPGTQGTTRTNRQHRAAFITAPRISRSSMATRAYSPRRSFANGGLPPVGMPIPTRRALHPLKPNGGQFLTIRNSILIPHTSHCLGIKAARYPTRAILNFRGTPTMAGPLRIPGVIECPHP